jgi:AcrR family transcriptional regulator
MPRITPERREARRAQIMAAARRCFARDGFHQTSMPDIAAEAGISAGAPYRYFASKDEIILAITADAFRLVFAPMELLAAATDAPLVADLVTASLEVVGTDTVTDAAGHTVPVDELLRCVVQTWSELLRNDAVHTRAAEGFDGTRRTLAGALRRGREAGTVPVTVDPNNVARVLIALLHGLLLQRAAFGLVDTTALHNDIRTLLQAPQHPIATAAASAS